MLEVGARHLVTAQENPEEPGGNVGRRTDQAIARD
jgi:hypothetical protein